MSLVASLSDLFYPAPLILLLTLLLLTHHYLRRARDPLRTLPTLPRSLLHPLDVLHCHRTGADPYAKLATLVQDPRHRQLCVSRGWDATAVIVSDPSLIRDLLVRRLANYGAGHTVQRSSAIRETNEMFSGGPHVGNTRDDDWRWRRANLVPLFQPRRLVPALLPFLCGRVNRMCEQLERCAKEGGTLNVDAEMMIMTLDVINKYVFGLGNDELDFQDVGGVHKLGPQFGLVIRHTFSPWPRLPLIGRTHWVRQVFTTSRAPIDAFISRSLAHTLSDPTLLVGTVPPVAACLAPLYAPLSDPTNYANLRRDLYTLVFAGHDTTSHTAAFAFGLLARRRDLQERCAKEAREVLGEGVINPEEIKMEMLARLSYISAVIREVQRLYPAAAFVSVEPKVDIEIGGYVVPAGRFPFYYSNLVYPEITFSSSPDNNTPTLHPLRIGTEIMCNIRGAYALSTLFPDPSKFDPSRWLSNSSASIFEDLASAAAAPTGESVAEPAKDTPSSASNPLPELAFGLGAHACLGRNLAMLELRAVLAIVLARFELLPREGEENEDVKSMTVFTLAPVGGVWLRVRER
ncbi:cytochrome P450 [Jimgerdemannia flammicorona]|uniref:Cytochrome P450 n=1 Tax=Jimgerdemannia flammicorona TaxID=994334 RepID=A0A433Q9J3_9FUNG|nr:cytochrome P450 [Jimgerdemannia flammicorona]